MSRCSYPRNKSDDDDFKIIRMIGAGAHGTVFLVKKLGSHDEDILSSTATQILQSHHN